jgi:hypothetical protein
MPQQSEPTNAQLLDAAERVAKEWADKGMLIEGGWRAMAIVSGLTNAPINQLRDMRKAYMMGAQHLFSSIMVVMDPGGEATEADLRRMELIHIELEAFRKSLQETEWRPGHA